MLLCPFMPLPDVSCGMNRDVYHPGSVAQVIFGNQVGQLLLGTVVTKTRAPMSV